MDQALWAILRRNPFFGELPEATAIHVLAGRPPTNYAKGQVVFMRGDRADGFHIVVEGWVKLVRSMPDGTDAVIGVYSVGESLSEAPVLLGGLHQVTAEMASDGRIQRIDARRLIEAVKADETLAFAMLAAASLRLKRLVDQVEELKSLDNVGRLARFLVGLAGGGTGETKVVLPYEKHLIAGRLGMSPESFSRALAKLKAHGVAVDREVVSIKDVDRLAVLA